MTSRALTAPSAKFALLSYLIIHTSYLPATASDWPQILGLNRNGVYEGKDLAATWPKGGPKTLWKMDVGDGFAGPAVADGKLILFHRIGGNEVVQALDAESGKPLWKHEYPTAYRDDFGFDPGPRAVPTIADGKVFTYGADGRLTALSLADGKRLWDKDCKYFFDSPKGFFGRASSPLFIQDRVLVAVGGKSAGIVTFNKDDGTEPTKGFSDEASYSSPTIIQLIGPFAAVLTRTRLVIFNPRNLLLSEARASSFDFKPPIDASVTGATPIAVSNQIFITASYGLGAALLQQEDTIGLQRFKKVLEKNMTSGVIAEPIIAVDTQDLKVIWSNDTSLSCHYSTPVHRDGFLYGLHGRHDSAAGTELRCIEWATGKVRWSKPGLKGANVLLAGDSLLVLTENGELIRAEAKPEGYRELARAQILGLGVRAYPALANGRFYARDKRQLVCVDLRP